MTDKSRIAELESEAASWKADAGATLLALQEERVRFAELTRVLSKLRSAVFGDQAGDEPNVYSDYDALLALEGEARAALSLGGGLDSGSSVAESGGTALVPGPKSDSQQILEKED